MTQKPLLSPISTHLSERAQVRLLPVLVTAALGTAAVCLWETLATPGVLAESVLMAPLLAWAIYQAQTNRLRAQVVGQINQRLNSQMTELWQVQQALQSSEARFQAFMDNSPAVAFIKDDAGRYVYLNEPFARRFGVSQTEWLGKTVQEVLPADIADALRQDSEAALAGKSPHQTLETVPTPDDPDCQWLSLRFPFQDSSGKQFLGCVAIDVTRQQRAEDHRREAADKLAALVEASPLAIFSFDCAGRIQSWSLAAERLFGWREDEVMGRSLPFVPEELQEESRALIGRLLHGETLTDIEATRRRRDGSLLQIAISAAPLHDSEGRVTGAMALAADITGRKKNDAMRVRMEEILTATSDFVGIATPQGQILFHNQAFLTLTGNDSESVRLRRMGDFYPAWAMEMQTQEALPAVMRDGIWSGEAAFLAADGTEVPVSQVILAHYGPNKELAGFSTIARDLTERKRTEEELRQMHREMEDRVLERTSDLSLVNEWLHDEIAVRQKAEESLRESEERYRFLADSMPQIVWTSPPDGRPNYYNQQWNLYTGLTPEQTESGGWEPAVHPDDRERLQEIALAAQKDGKPHAWEYRLKRADGEYRWHLGRTLPLRDAAGEIILWVGTGTDIDDVKQAEADLRLANDDLEERVQERTQALHTEQEFLHALLDNLQDGIAACDADGTLTVFNQATRDFHGLPEMPLPPNEWARHFDLYEIDGKTPLSMENIPLYRAWKGENVRQADMVIAPRHGKTRAIRASGQAILAPDGKTLGAVIAMHDITERKAMERMKNEFISVVSHELRTPLTSIRGALGLVDGGVAGEIAPQAKTLVSIAYNNTERLVSLVNDILDIEKIEAGKMEFLLRPILVKPLLLETLENLRTYAAQHGVELEMAECPAETVICTDSDRLAQILTNLISNAAKFSPPGETVQIGAEHVADQVRIRVRDHGPGIPPEFQDRIFQKFAQADSADTRLRGGTGLGLSICKAMVEKLGGKIGFETESGRGTMFYVDLPAYSGGAHDGN